MRQIWFAVALILLAGCSSHYQGSIEAVKLALHGQKLVEPTVASVAAKPYFQLQATTPDGRAVLVLGGVEGNLRSWYGQTGQALFLEHGVVVRTIGLQQNLDNKHWLSANPFAEGLQKLDSPFDGICVVDWSPGYRYNVTLKSHLTPAGMEAVTILGTTHQLRRIDELVTSSTAAFVSENHYWVDPQDGFIWKSHQVVAPGLPLDLIQLRPYLEAKR